MAPLFKIKSKKFLCIRKFQFLVHEKSHPINEFYRMALYEFSTSIGLYLFLSEN